MSWLPHESIVYGLVGIGSLIFVFFYQRRMEFNRGRDKAKYFLRAGMSVEALRSYTDLMRANSTYGQFDAGLDSIAKEYV